MDSEQPKSLNEIMEERSNAEVKDMFTSAFVVGLGMIARSYRSDKPKVADAIEVEVDKIKEQQAAYRLRAILRDYNYPTTDF